MNKTQELEKLFSEMRASLGNFGTSPEAMNDEQIETVDIPIQEEETVVINVDEEPVEDVVVDEDFNKLLEDQQIELGFKSSYNDNTETDDAKPFIFKHHDEEKMDAANDDVIEEEQIITVEEPSIDTEEISSIDMLSEEAKEQIEQQNEYFEERNKKIDDNDFTYDSERTENVDTINTNIDDVDTTNIDMINVDTTNTEMTDVEEGTESAVESSSIKVPTETIETKSKKTKIFDIALDGVIVVLLGVAGYLAYNTFFV